MCVCMRGVLAQSQSGKSEIGTGGYEIKVGGGSGAQACEAAVLGIVAPALPTGVHGGGVTLPSHASGKFII